MTKNRKFFVATATTAVSAILIGAVGVAAEQQIYSDVSMNHQYVDAILALTEANVVVGFADGTFRPDANVSRGQAAKMIAGTFGLDTTPQVKDPKFKDVPLTNAYYKWISILATAGLVQGYGDQTFKPDVSISHGHLKQIIQNASYAYEVNVDTLFTLANVAYSEKKLTTRGELASILSTALTMLSEHNAENYKLSILHLNDTHARVAQFPKIMTAVKEQRAEKPDTLLLHAGDVFSGTLYFSEFQGQADLAFLNKLKVDYLTLGNHEFDLGASSEGHKALVDFIQGANFPIVSSNVDFSGDAKFTGLFTDLVSSDPENGKIYSGIIKEINGEKIGIFGLTTAETKDISSPGAVKFENYIDEAKKAVKAFEDKGVNKIIALTHIGYDDNALIDNDLELAKNVPGIDIIVGGHSHTQLNEPVFVNTNTVGEKSDGTLILQAYQYGDFLGTLDVEFDKEGIVVGYNGKLLKIADYADDAEGLKLLAPYKEKIDVTSNDKIGVKLTEDLINPRSSETSLYSVRANETALGNIITDGMLQKARQYTTKTVVMALQNGGGIRSEIKAGDVTTGQVISVLPFGNTLALMDVTGAELKAAFEHSVKEAPKESGGFLHVSGAKLQFDSSKPAGSRVISIQYYDIATNSYVDIDPAKTYTVATNAFTAKGGDNFDMFKKAYEENRVTDLGLSDWENLKEQLLSLKTIRYEAEGRIVDAANKQ
jgi:5'-nucleotidase / UDP-sugar diphosphatase